jgi:hypothetical protein
LAAQYRDEQRDNSHGEIQRFFWARYVLPGLLGVAKTLQRGHQALDVVLGPGFFVFNRRTRSDGSSLVTVSDLFIHRVRIGKTHGGTLEKALGGLVEAAEQLLPFFNEGPLGSDGGSAGMLGALPQRRFMMPAKIQSFVFVNVGGRATHCCKS